MTHSPETLAAIGRALYGPQWKGPLSEALGISDRTMRRWINGDYDIPQGVWDELLAVIEKRRLELSNLVFELA